MDIYLWLKALHIIAVVTWIGGMLGAGLALGIFPASSGATDRTAALDAVSRWDRRVTAPAMVLVWVLGLTLALRGGWFGAPWLTIKLVLVLALSALHGLLSGSLRRLTRADSQSSPARLRYVPALTLAAAAAIIILVVVKPY